MMNLKIGQIYDSLNDLMKDAEKNMEINEKNMEIII